MDLDNCSILPYIEKKDWYFIKNYCSVNGAPSVNAILVSFLKDNHFVRVFTLAKHSFIVKSNNLEVYAITPYNVKYLRGLYGLLVDANNLRTLISKHYQDLDVIHAHWTYNWAYATLSFCDKLPVFCTIRDWLPVITSRLKPIKRIFWIQKRFMNNRVLSNDNIHLIANSPYISDFVKKDFSKDIPIIPNPISSDFCLEGKHRNPDTITVVCISSGNDKRKNLISLLKAFQLFFEAHPSSKLVIIGKIEKNSIYYSWKSQGLLNGVELVGSVPHNSLKCYLDHSTMFVSPSLEESFGNTLIESIARKVPVIGGKNSGAVPYVLKYGEAGYLCDVSRPEEICEQMNYIVSHPNEVAEKVEVAYQITLERFLDKNICRQHIDLYKKVISTKR